MKAYFKIALVLVAVTCVWLYFKWVQFRCETTDTITLTGDITPKTFVVAREYLVSSKALNKTFIVTSSGGGDAETALALGKLIHKYNWNVEVIDLCASSCANFIFPAGRVKYLNRSALLLYHGGPHQSNLLEFVKNIDTTIARKGSIVVPKEIGRKNMEGQLHISIEKNEESAAKEVHQFLGISDHIIMSEQLQKLISMSDEFYKELGVNVLLPTYGQIGEYESTYKSYKYDGFAYSLESLRRLGINNIQLRRGEWHPELNPVYKDIYQVTYP